MTRSMFTAALFAALLTVQFLFGQSVEQTCKSRLPQTVNSFQPAILPVLTVDGKILYFDRKLHPENAGGTKDLDDIWYSVYSKETSFKTPENLGTKFNTGGSDVVFSITPDGTALIYGTKYSPNTYSIAEINDTEFENFIPVKIEDYYNNATNFFAYLSADKNVLLLSLNRKDSRGDLDLYVSFREGNSFNFTKPLNLGKTINTKHTEGSPFLAYDNKTLYFSTNGRQGFGGKDLYMTRRLDDTWMHWSEPVNLGATVNTAKDDNGICLTALGDSAIVTSWDKETMREGMYYICLPDSLRPEPYIIVAGNISGRDIRLTNFKSIDIEVANDKNNNKEHYKPLYGNRFYFVLRSGVFSPIIVRKKGFEEFGFAVNSNNLKHSKFVYYNALLSKARSNNIRIGTVLFKYNDANLDATGYKQISEAMEKVIEPAETQVYVIGHTDEKGSEQYNLELSKRRAEAVKKELVNKGLKPGNVIVLYKGESEPVSQEDEKNRRVEIILIDY